MRYGKLMVVAACGALFVVGCEKKKAAPANESNSTMEHLQKSAEEQAGNAKETAKSAEHNMENMASNAKEKASSAAENASNAISNSQAAKDAANELQQVQTYIKEHKYDLADKTLSELEDHKSSLPESIQAQLPGLRKQVDALKSANGQ